MSFLKLIILVAINITLCDQGARRLHQHLFSNYDSKSRPVERPQTVTNVCVDLYLLQIVRINEKNQVRTASDSNDALIIFLYLVNVRHH